MAARSKRSRSARRRTRRYIVTLVLAVALIGGWSGFWYYAAGKAEVAIDGWRAREAKAGRVYSCGSQSIGGYPFRIEVNCHKAAALLRSSQPPVEIKAGGMLIAAQIYQPNLLITEFHGPAHRCRSGEVAVLVVNWKLAQSSVRGTPAAPERVSIALDKPVVERIGGGGRHVVLRARHAEIHGRIVAGSVAAKPVIETVLRLTAASAPELHPAAVAPFDADITAVLYGLHDFSPKPWPVRFREMQAAGGRIDITQARAAAGRNHRGRRRQPVAQRQRPAAGPVARDRRRDRAVSRVVGAQQTVQASPDMDKVAGALDRLLPGLGDAARQQATSTNLSLGINLLGEQTTLEGKRAVTLPLRFDDGAILLGPIRIGTAPALF